MSALAVPAGERMGASDSLLWTIERDPVLRSTVVVVCVLDRTPDLCVVRGRITDASSRFPRLRQCVVASRRGPPCWTSDAATDLDRHIQHIAVPAPGSMRQVLDLAGAMAGEAFDPARPLWKVLAIDGLADGRAALVLKVHHAITDGVGGVALLPLLTDPSRTRSSRHPPSPASDPARSAFVQTITTIGNAVTHPCAALQAVPHVAGSMARLLAPAPHACSPLMTRRGVNRSLTTIDRPRQELDTAARAAGGTLNDAFLAAVFGGLSRYHAQHGAPVDHLRVTMPISTRRGGDGPRGNRFVPARFVAPASISDPVQRMQALGAIARSWREDPALRHSSVVADVLERLPGDITTALVGSMLKGVDVVATNVPGLARRASIGGAVIERMYGLAPTAGAAVDVALVSHTGRCCIGITVDTAAVSDPDELTACLDDAFDEVVEVGRSTRGGRTRRNRRTS